MTGRLCKLLICSCISLAFLAAAASPAFAGKKDNTLNFAWTKELESLDRYYNTAREGMIVSRHVYDDLIYRDPVTWEYKPLLAKSFKWVDNTTIEFELRKGITFHNGEKFDAGGGPKNLDNMLSSKSALQAC